MTRIKWDIESVREYIKSFGYTLLSEKYINNSTKLKMICPNGHLCEITYCNFRNGRRCKDCYTKNKKYKYEEVKIYIEKEGYELLSNEYKNVNTHLKVKCPNGHIWETCTFRSFKNNNARCKHCAAEERNKNRKFNYEFVKKYIESFGYKLLSTEYKNIDEKLLIQCDKGHEYEASFYIFKNMECRCPHCNESKGEKEIIKILNNMGIEYNSQYRFSDCKFKHTLPFDFYLPGYNCCIEYDGEGHYEPFNFNKNKDKNFENFIDTKIRDTIKDKYCKDNNIKLIRIPYWEFKNIEKIIKNELNLK